jgi:hypothetical protein
VARSSCEPDAPPQAGCKADKDCAGGSVCDSATGSCTATCKCVNDADAVKQGADFCDEARQTCVTGKDPNGVCDGAVTCTAAKPTCGDGQVETDCTARATDCTAVSEGHGCTRTDGSACHTGDTDCKCASFTFQACEAKAGNLSSTRIVYE